MAEDIDIHTKSSVSSDDDQTVTVQSVDTDVPLAVAVERVSKLYAHEQLKRGWKATLAMAIRSLGVIYGDIGTSVLYVVPAIFSSQNIPVTDESALGAASLIIWSLFLIVCVKYVMLVLKMDNHGEGGIFALLFLIPPISKKIYNIFVVATLFGSSFVIGDGCITPAISILSAIEGIETKAPGLTQYVFLITAIIILALFMAQRFGTSKIGISFGPIMVLWFFSIACFGINEIVKQPRILAALSPHYGLKFLFGDGGILVLATVVLCVTGVEALYADLGHFGLAPIRVSWLFVVFPAVSLNYLGQCAHLLGNPGDIDNLFYLSSPSALFWPLLILATVATVIASQAMISGVFSLINQAVSFQFFPNVKVYHTSRKQLGQIYIPEINYIMMVLTVVIVLAFKKSANLSAAYGVAVCAVMVLTSVMYIAVLHFKKQTAWWKIAIFAVVFLTIDFTFFATTLTKVMHGGWLPIVIGVVFALVMWVWKMGREELEDETERVSMTYSQLQTLMHYYNVSRPATCGVFMTAHYDATPQSLSVILPRMRSLPNPSIFLTVRFVPVPYMSENDRVVFQKVPELDGVAHAVITYGFAEAPNISEVIHKMAQDGQITIHPNNLPAEVDLNIPSTTYYLSRERIVCDKKKWIGHRIWVKFFNLLVSNSRGKADVFNIPSQELVDVGFPVEL